MTHALLRHAKPSPECLRKRALYRLRSALGELDAAIAAVEDERDVLEQARDIIAAAAQRIGEAT